MHRKTMALALGGGGMRGAAHVGVLKVLENEGIPIDYIVGNSMGAIVGGLYASGVPIEQLCDERSFRAFRDSYVPTLGAKLLKLPLTVLLPLRTGPVGIMSGRKYQKYLQKQIPEGKEKIEALNIPYSAVATNLLDGQAYRLSEGDLSLAMRASSSLAPIIRPVKVGNKLCVDGGVRANLPASAARDTGADVVIAVVVDDKLKEVPEKNMWHYRKLAERMANIMLAVTDEQQMQFADIVIAPEVSNISILSKNKDDILRAMHAGEIAARKALPLIREKLHLPPGSQLTESSP
jgi:NTE family protein